jgi:general nucleoside transport system permease protein
MNKKPSSLIDVLRPIVPTDLKGLVISGFRPLLAISLALIVSAILILAYGKNPITAYAALLDGAIGSIPSLANTGVRSTPLLFGGLAVALAFQAGMLNVGVEGQIYAGAAAATTIGLIPLPVPPIIHLTLAIIAGFLGGVVWGLVPAFLRAFKGRSEIVTTLMFNFIGIYFVSYLVQFPGPLAQEGATFPMSPPILRSALLPILIKGTSLHAGIILGIILIAVFYFILRYTPFGYRVRMTGQNPEAARYAGVKVPWLLFFVLLLSGGLGGIAGTSEVLGLRLRLFDFFAGGLGYDAIGVALLANANPIGVVLSALFFGALRSGASRMQIVVGIDTPIAEVIQALAVLFVIAIGFGQRVYDSKRKKKTRETDSEVTDTHGN